MITMQKEKKKFCPLCRDDVVMHADSGTFPSFVSLLSSLLGVKWTTESENNAQSQIPTVTQVQKLQRTFRIAFVNDW